MEFNDIRALWEKVFPDSHVSVGKPALGGGAYIRGYFQKPDQWINKISNNDPLSYTAFIEEDGSYRETATSLLQKPDSPYYVYSSIRLRKKSIKKVDETKLYKRFLEIKAWIDANYDNLPDKFK